MIASMGKDLHHDESNLNVTPIQLFPSAPSLAARFHGLMIFRNLEFLCAGN